MTTTLDVIPQIKIAQDIIQASGVRYEDIYDGIRIFGTFEHPLFSAKDVQTKLGLKNLRYKGDDSHLLWGKHRVKLYIVRDNNKIGDAILLTLEGLFEAIYASKAPAALAFRDYIYVVMDQLRTKGIVTTESAEQGYQEYKQKIEDQQKEIENQKKLLEEKNKELQKVTNTRDNYGRQVVEYNEIYKEDKSKLDDKIVTLKSSLRKIKNETGEERIQEQRNLSIEISKFNHHYLKRVYLYLHKQSDEIDDEDEIDEEDYDFADVTVDELGDNVHLFSFSTGRVRPTATKRKMRMYLVHPEITIVNIQNKLLSMTIPVVNNVFKTSINNIEYAIGDLNRNVKATWAIDNLEGIYVE
jgi:prophage antirepressor-like protein